MSLINCQNVSKAYGTDALFAGASFLIEKGSRTALIGDNGAGKSTLMKIVMGLVSPDEGRVITESGTSLGYLPQDAGFDGSFELLGSCACGGPALADALANLRAKKKQLEKEPDSNAAAAGYGDAVHEFEALGGFSRLEEAKKVLSMLGFLPGELELMPGHLSGGQKTRAHLARLLLGDHDVLLLDEPTNHLDTEACERFVDFLNNQFSGAALIISHDRYFLDQTVSSVLSLDKGVLKEYKGNYTDFRNKKTAEEEALARSAKEQKKVVERMEQAIQTLFSHRNFSARDSMVKKLGRVKEIAESSAAKRMTVRISSDKRSGREVLKIEGLSKAFGEKKLFDNVCCVIERGTRTGIVGPNGSGKSTFIKIISGAETADSGALTFGVNVKMAYFAQEFDHLSPSRTVLEELLEDTDISSSEARKLLGQFLFSGDDAFKTVEQLSGGEKCRLSLAKIMAEKPNFLLLDEPTNHLDTASCEILEKAVREYDGTVLAVSHDRYFLEHTTGATMEIKNGAVTFFPGSWSYYREKSKSPEKERPPEPQKPAERPVNNRDLRSKLKPLAD
ncbi:MAG: ABC-F family ATP-binding cassette domain-containing protein, partial [Abditibacteriota bacterium]|nr:ABC-F family ATP-binding cassette domain-containing protein [Abditibacteriota bacterium]